MTDTRRENLAEDIQSRVMKSVKEILEAYMEFDDKTIAKASALASSQAVEALRGKPRKKI